MSTEKRPVAPGLSKAMRRGWAVGTKKKAAHAGGLLRQVPGLDPQPSRKSSITCSKLAAKLPPTGLVNSAARISVPCTNWPVRTVA